VAKQEGFEAQLGGLKIAYGIFPIPAQVADGFICHCGGIDGCEIIGAHQASQLHRITTVGGHAITRLVRKSLCLARR
jgi:hypothetical protein